MIRRLDLGCVDDGVSSQHLALLIERTIRALQGDAVHFASPRAEDAPVVFAADRVEAWTAFIERVLRTGFAKAWYWPRFVPGYRPGMAPATAARLALAVAGRSVLGPVAIVRIMGRLVRGKSFKALMSALSRADGEVLLALCQWTYSPAPKPVLVARRDGGAVAARAANDSELADESAAQRATPQDNPPTVAWHWVEVLREWVARWGVDDPRSVWLAAIAIAAGGWGAVASPTLLRRAVALAEAHGPEQASARRVEEQALRGEQKRPSPDPSEEVALAELEATPTKPATGELEAPDRPETQRDEPSVDERQFSAFGGLYFVIRALRCLRFEAFLEAHPEAWDIELGHRVLCAIAVRAGVPSEDPILLALTHGPATDRDDAEVGSSAKAASEGDVDRVPLPFSLPPEVCEGLCAMPLHVGWRDGDKSARVVADDRGWVISLERTTGLVDAATDRMDGEGRGEGGRVFGAGSDVATLVESWVEGVVRWLERYADMDLAAVVLRPARVACTSTHIDVFFALEDADLAVRRAALDINPGWVPWLGRVITFHYGRDA